METTKSDRGQVISSAAEVYDEFFVPALFGEWPAHVMNLANIQPGQKVLDVACGTGVLARTIAEQIGAQHVIGLDVNPGMLAVAGRRAPLITWRQGQAEHMPFEDARFDAVVCQFGLMFFEDRHAAIKEMARILKPGGQLAIAVWDTLENTPGYARMVELLLRLFGEEAADGLRAPYNLGDVETLRGVFTGSGLRDLKISTIEGTARFPSIDAWVYTDIKGWVLAELLNDAQVDELLREAKTFLSEFVQDDRHVAFSAPAHIVSARKP